MPDELPASGPPSQLEHILLQALLRHLPDSVYFKDRESRFLRVNSAMARWVGVPDPKDLVGLTDSDLFTHEHAQPARDDEQRIIATGKPLLDIEEKETWTDGRVTWVSTSKLPLYDLAGAIIGTFGISRDITIQKLAEAEFRRSETTLRALLSAVPVGIALLRDRTLLTVNPMLVRIVGYSADELRGHGTRLLYADDAEYDRLGTLRGEPTDEAPRGATTRWRHKNGTLIDVEITLAPLLQQEHAGEWVMTAVDITGRLRAEAQRQELRAQLDLAQKLESVGRLSAGIAHEINTPGQFVADNLRFLSRSLEQLERYFAAVEPLRAAAAAPAAPDSAAAVATEIELDYLREELPRCIGQSLEGMERIARIVAALRDFAHPAATGRAPVELAGLIETTIAVSRHEWKYVAEITTDFDPRQPPVPVVADEFNQALLNLIINAAQAVAALPGPRSGAKGRICIRTRTTPTHALVEIEDTGAGIPAAVRPHLFEPFATGRGAANAAGQGLHIVHGIVRRHGGKIEYDTEIGRGTTFRLLLPLQPVAPPETATP